MSPAMSKKAKAPEGFPRVSGDEPSAVGSVIDWFKFSPRERG